MLLVIHDGDGNRGVSELLQALLGFGIGGDVVGDERDVLSFENLFQQIARSAVGLPEDFYRGEFLSSCGPGVGRLFFFKGTFAAGFRPRPRVSGEGRNVRRALAVLWRTWRDRTARPCPLRERR